MFFSVITKNLNWEILTKNLKDGMGLRMKNFTIMEGSLKNQIFKGGFTKDQYIRGNYLKRGA